MPVGQTGPSHTAQHYFRVRGKPTIQVQVFFQYLPDTGFSESPEIFWLLFLILLFITFYRNHYYPFASNSTEGWRLPLCQTCSNKDVAGLLTCLHSLCYCSSSHLHFRVLCRGLGGRSWRGGTRWGEKELELLQVIIRWRRRMWGQVATKELLSQL